MELFHTMMTKALLRLCIKFKHPLYYIKLHYPDKYEQMKQYAQDNDIKWYE